MVKCIGINDQAKSELLVSYAIIISKDLNAYLPYLSKYMGHVDFRGTEYYLKLTADLYPYLIEKMNEHQMGIIPVREDN